MDSTPDRNESGGERSADRKNSGRRDVAGITVSVILAWLLPGAGHFYLNRRWKALVFLGLVALCLCLGLFLDGKLYTPERGKLLSYFGTFASLGLGPVYFILRAAGIGMGTITSATYDYGNLFILTAGLMNILLVIDAFDIAMGRK